MPFFPLYGKKEYFFSEIDAFCGKARKKREEKEIDIL